MPLFRVRRERCIPYEVVVEAPTLDEAESAAFSDNEKWSEGCAYWQELSTDELEDGDDEPAIVVQPDVDAGDDGDDEEEPPLLQLLMARGRTGGE